MEIIKNLIKSELNRTVNYISEHPLFIEEYKYKVLGLKISKKTYSEEYRKSATKFLSSYFYFLGELFNRAKKINELKEDMIIKLNNFNKLNPDNLQFEIPEMLKQEIVIDSDIDNVSDCKEFYLFLTGKQIGCINRAILLNKEEDKKEYCFESLELLKNITLDLIDFIYNHSLDEINDNYEIFFKERVELIKKETKKRKLAQLINGYFNFYDIYSRIKYGL